MSGIAASAAALISLYTAIQTGHIQAHQNALSAQVAHANRINDFAQRIGSSEPLTRITALFGLASLAADDPTQRPPVVQLMGAYVHLLTGDIESRPQHSNDYEKAQAVHLLASVTSLGDTSGYEVDLGHTQLGAVNAPGLRLDRGFL